MTTEPDPPMVNLAAPDTLLGMLQRGRGRGYLLALKAPAEEVWPILFECITNDPRLDWQCEFRQEYYAGLAVATGMDLEPLRWHVKKTDADGDDFALVLNTLLCLAGELRSTQALDIVCEYLSYGNTREAIQGILHLIGEMGTADSVARVVEVLCHRAGNDPDFRSAFGHLAQETWQSYCSTDLDRREQGRWLLPFCEPWRTICRTNPQFAALFSDLGIDFDQPGPPRERVTVEHAASLSLEDLFAQADKSNCVVFCRVLSEKVSMTHEDYLLEQLSSGDPSKMMLALRGLGTLGTPKAFEAVKSYIEASGNTDSMDWPNQRARGEAFRAFSEMPGALTLDTARQWFRREEWHLQVPAGRALENHATLEDIPLLLEFLREPETAERVERRFSFALQAMWLFSGFGRVPELEDVFRRVGNSYRRRDAAEAMYVTAPDHFVDQYAFECLWDCHWDTRELACDAVSLSTPGAAARLQEIASDPYENGYVREAAQARLGSPTDRSHSPE